MVRRLFGILAIGTSAVALGVGCSGGGSTSVARIVPVASAFPSSAPVAMTQSGNVTLSITVPAVAKLGAAHRREYVSPSTATLVVIVSQNNVVKQKVTEIVASPPCVKATDGSQTCTFAITVAPGTATTFQVQAFDGSNYLLSEGTSMPTPITMDAANVVKVTLLGDVASVAISLATAIPACTATTAPLTVTAKDADGNIISGQFDYPITLTASYPAAFPSPAAAATPNSSVSPSTLAQATGTPTPLLTYNGNSPGGSTITATVAGGTSVAGTVAVGSYSFAPTPKICAEYAITGSQTTGTAGTGPGPRGIVTAPDNYLYETNFSSGTVGRVTSTLGTGSTPVGTIVPIPFTLALMPKPNQITVGPGDGNLWITDDANGIDTIPYGNTVNQATGQNTYSQDSGGQGAEQPEGIIAAPSGSALFYANSVANQIVNVTTAGVFTVYALTTPAPGPTPIPSAVPSPNPSASATALPTAAPNPGPRGIVTGPDGRLYFTEMRGDMIGAIAPAAVTAPMAGSSQTEYPVTSGAQPDYITVAGKLLWFTEFSGSIGNMTTGGTVKEFPIGGHSVPIQIVYAADGNLFFTDTGNNAIGRITPTGSITEYPAITGASAPFGITLGPDKHVWFTESSGGNVGYLGY